MGQSNEFRSLMRKWVETLPMKDRTPALRTAMEDFAERVDAAVSRLDAAGNAPSESQGASGEGGSGGGSAAARGSVGAQTTGVAAKMPKRIAMMTATRNVSPLVTPRTTITVGAISQADYPDSHNDGYPSLNVAMIASGESVKPTDAIYVANNLAYLAHASADAAHPFGLPCNAMAVRGTGLTGEIIYTRGGTVVGRPTGSSSSRVTLKLSVTPGRLTFLDAESPSTKLFHQEVGFFDKWVPQTLGDASPTLCELAFFPFPPAST